MQHFIATYGYLAIFLLMVAESACIPIPSELIMTFGGALAAGAVPGTSLNLAGVIIRGYGWQRRRQLHRLGSGPIWRSARASAVGPADSGSASTTSIVLLSGSTAMARGPS